jgi:hypothetical protein
MRACRIGRTKKARRLRSWAPGFCLFASLFAIAVVARPELRAVLAQSSASQATSLQDLTGPAPDPSAQAHLIEPAAKQETHVPPPTDPQQKQIYDDGANLLKLANTLKAEVDKTTPDTLSLTVIRRADEIEKLAHRMRGK